MARRAAGEAATSFGSQATTSINGYSSTDVKINGATKELNNPPNTPPKLIQK